MEMTHICKTIKYRLGLKTGYGFYGNIDNDVSDGARNF